MPMHSPCLRFDLDKIEHNARTIVGLCGSHGIEVAGVTKAVCGNPQIAAAMIHGGAKAIADSRLENLHRLKEAGIESLFMLLRLPPQSDVREVVESADVSLNSEMQVLQSLSDFAMYSGRRHDVVLMVDLGDLREGVWPDDFVPFAGRAAKLPGIRIKGVGANLACLAGVMPDAKNMRRLVELSEDVERSCRIRLDWISGINSSGLELLASGGMPKRINHARIGEAILLGRETTHRKPWADTFQDAFTVEAEIIELKLKPSAPDGEVGEDAFGGRRRFEDRGERLHALLNIGREDIDFEGIVPLDPRLSVTGATSDYLVVDATAAEGVKVGDKVRFSVNYGALLAAMTSEYVKKIPLRAGTDQEGGRLYEP
ncbi:MAG: alanine/ornithine racemase family PLP-dependent enzyme [Gammaproteobacteria bacterium]